MRKYLLLLLLIPFANLVSAQTWDGGGNGTSWDDAMNWDNDAVPAAGDIVTIGADVTIDGTVTNNPSRVIIGSNFTVTIATNMTIGDGTTTEHALKVQGNSTLNLGSGAGETFTISIATNKDGIQHNATGTPANIVIASGSTFTVSQARDGISFTGSGSNTIVNNGTINISGVDRDGILVKSGTFTNNGIVNITSANQDGIDNESMFNNDGTLSIVDANSNGINNRATGIFNNTSQITITNPSATTTDGILSVGTINNTTSGIITSTKMDDDCIELTGGVFTNDGTVNVTAEDAAASGNNGIAVGTASAAATFINTSNNSVNADGGLSSNGRAIYVFEMGTLTNTGTMTLTGGNTGSTLYSRGLTNNEEGATIDLGDGRINVNQGIFTNDGLIESTRTSPSVFSTATATNNAFFKYATGTNTFATGSGTNTDNGISLNDVNETTIEANGLCTVDIAETTYTYFNDGNVVATTDASGMLTIPMDGVISDPAVLTLNEYPNKVVLTINDICPQSVLPIELIAFSVAENRDRVLVKWTTASEINSDHIQVERSKNGRKWDVLDVIAAQGFSISEVDYEYTDKNPSTGLNYYRLKLVDLDGRYEYSDIKQIDLSNRIGDIKVYPTMLSVGDQLNIELSNDLEKVQIFATRFDGRTTSLGTLNGGTSSIDITNLLSGAYVISVVDDSGTHSTKITILR